MPKAKKIKRSISYDEWLIKKLKNHELAGEYLNNALKEALKSDNDDESLELLLMALRNVIQAQGGVAKIARPGLGEKVYIKLFLKRGILNSEQLVRYRMLLILK